MSDAISCKLCIIGAGLSGLNALFVAADKLKKTDKVVLIDRNVGAGGMWNNTYDHVRLHQPHRMFTVGNLAWEPKRPPAYLPTGAEVNEHLRSCVNRLRKRIDLTELYSHEMVSSEETPDGVEVTCKSLETGETVSVMAEKLIDASASDIPVSEPLELQSSAVVSTTPEKLKDHVYSESDTPIYVVGGGKTGIDTIGWLAKVVPNRKTILINGKGVSFTRRESAHPQGLSRWTDGDLFVRSFRNVAMEFDGTNENDAYQYFHDTYAISLKNSGLGHLFAYLSEEELETAEHHLHEIIPDYIEDVVDTPNGPQLVLRSGETRPVPAGSLVVNCTGYVMRRDRPEMPFLSDGGRILSITPRSAVFFLPAAGAFFLTQLFLTGKLPKTDVYSVDLTRMMDEDKRLLHMTAVSLSLLNHITFLDTIPVPDLLRCGLDIDRWFPLPRRGLLIMDLKLNGKRYQRHCRQSLAKVEERTGATHHSLSHSKRKLQAA
ncbi:MAG: potassium transporter [Pseudomonadota bacterium]